MPPEATQVSPLIPFSPMPGGALTANTQMMRDNKILDKFPAVIKAMREVVEKGGFGTSVTPVSQFYFQQAFNNVMFGPWKKIAEGYGKMVLGYFGKTPVKPDEGVIKMAAEQLGLQPTTKHAVDIADADESKSVAYAQKILREQSIEPSEENIFIALACKEKGIAFLKGEGKVMSRKKEDVAPAASHQSSISKNGKFDVKINGKIYNVEFAGQNVLVNGDRYDVSFDTSAPAKPQPQGSAGEQPTADARGGADGNDIKATLPSNVFKILIKEGDAVKAGQNVIVLEAMKMEINIESPRDGVIDKILIAQGDTVDADQVLAILR